MSLFEANTGHITALMQIIRLMKPDAEALAALGELDSRLLKSYEVFDKNNPDWPKDIRAFAYSGYEAECHCRKYFKDGTVLESRQIGV